MTDYREEADDALVLLGDERFVLDGEAGALDRIKNWLALTCGPCRAKGWLHAPGSPCVGEPRT